VKITFLLKLLKNMLNIALSAYDMKNDCCVIERLSKYRRIVFSSKTPYFCILKSLANGQQLFFMS